VSRADPYVIASAGTPNLLRGVPGRWGQPDSRLINTDNALRFSNYHYNDYIESSYSQRAAAQGVYNVY